MPTIGAAKWIDGLPGTLPWYRASPKPNTPPSEPNSQYPLPAVSSAIPTIGAAKWIEGSPGTLPWYPADPNANTAPSPAVGGYPVEASADAEPIKFKLSTEIGMRSAKNKRRKLCSHFSPWLIGAQSFLVFYREFAVMKLLHVPGAQSYRRRNGNRAL